jgi:Fe-S cluster biogenesis protein NfuA
MDALTAQLTDHPLYGRIEAALDTIRGYLATDGGDVRVHSINEANAVEIEFLGACSNCSMSPMTMKAGVEEAVRKAVPEVTSITALNPTPMGS